MTEARKLRVFLCHSSQDKPIVREFYQRLNAEGWIEPWLDEEKLLPGQNWDMEIEKAVEAADAVIVCLSNNSVTKEGYVQRELKFVLDIALEKPEETIFIIPLRLEECNPPRRLRSWQYADYFPASSRDSAYKRLASSLRLRTGDLDIQTHEKNLNIPNDSGEVSGNKVMSERTSFGEIKFIKIPAGRFIMGSNDIEIASPQFEMDLPYDFWIGKFPVTNKQYEKYTIDDGFSFRAKIGTELFPVVEVRLLDAQDFIRWMNKMYQSELPPDYSFDLPLESEWEKASRGIDGRVYPWGNEFDPEKCNVYESGKGVLTPVGMYSPHGDSPFGVSDLAGNVWEWTRSVYRKYPYTEHYGQDKQNATDLLVLKGGSYFNLARNARCAFRNRVPAENRSDNLGFRLVISPKY
jgi:formylglycine-generating enzyme required for sulfatase activity